MKIRKILLGILFVISVTVGAFAEEYSEPAPVIWDAAQSNVTITAYPNYTTRVTYTAATAGRYALTWSTAPTRHSVDPWPQTYTVDGTEYEVVELTAGQKLIIDVYLDETADQSRSYDQTIKIQPWDGSLLLPDYPYIAEGEKVSVNLSSGESKNYLFRANKDGLYTQGQSYSSHSVNINQLNDYASPEMVTSWMANNQQGHVYRLTAGNIYLVEVSSSGGPQYADEIWIRAGDAPKNEYPIWQETEKKKSISLSAGETKSYYFTPGQTGEYALYRESTQTSIQIVGESAKRDFSAGNGQYHGEIYTLNAGQEYVIEISDRVGGVAETVYLEKTRPLTSAEIYLAQDPGDGLYVLAVRTDPLYAYAEGVQWSISDSSLFKIYNQSNVALDLKAVKSGTATITAKVGDITCTYKLTVGAATNSGGTATKSTSATILGSTPTKPTQPAETETKKETTATVAPIKPTEQESTQQTTAVQEEILENVLSRQTFLQLPEGESVKVSLNSCHLVVDKAAVKALLEQSQAESFTAQLERIDFSRFSKAQQAAVAGRKVGFALDLGIRGDDVDIHSFGDGIVTVKIPFAPDAGKAWDIFCLAEDGSAESLNAWVEDGQICFETNHFSVFALLYEQEAQTSGSWLIWAGIGAAIVAVGTTAVILLRKKKKMD